MIELEKLEEILGHKNCWRSENGQRVTIRSCVLGNNFYDYGEKPKSKIDFSNFPELKEIENDSRVHILTCSECCGCSDW